jgi:hypothetical protein
MTTATSAKPKSRFLRFSLRTLLVVMLVVCVTLGWKVEKTRKQREAVAWVEECGGEVDNEYEWDKVKPHGPKWLRDQLGVDFFDDVVSVSIHGSYDSDVTPLAGSDVTPLAGLRNLERLDLSFSQVSDVTPLAGLRNLKWLYLSSTQVSDVTPLAGLRNLERLDLSSTQVSDVTPLAGLRNLKWLYLRDTQVSDVTPLAGLRNLERLYLSFTQVSDVTPLAGLRNLKWLYLSSTQVSQEEYEMIQQALPKCRIQMASEANN